MAKKRSKTAKKQKSSGQRISKDDLRKSLELNKSNIIVEQNGKKISFQSSTEKEGELIYPSLFDRYLLAGAAKESFRFASNYPFMGVLEKQYFYESHKTSDGGVFSQIKTGLLRFKNVSGKEFKKSVDGLATVTPFVEGILQDLSEEAQTYLKEYFSYVIPSKRSPSPVFVRNVLHSNEGISTLGGNWTGDVILRAVGTNTTKFSQANHSTSEVQQNSLNQTWSSAAHMIPSKFLSMTKRHRFSDAFAEKYKGGDSRENPLLNPDGIKVWDYNCAILVDRSDTHSIFGNIRPEDFLLDLYRISGLWAGLSFNKNYAADTIENIFAEFIGGEHLSEGFAGSAPHYAAAMELGLRPSLAVQRVGVDIEGLDKLSQVSGLSPMAASASADHYAAYIGHMLSVVGREELIQKSEVVDDYLLSAEALDWLLSYRRKDQDTDVIDQETVDRLKKVQKAAREFGDLIDRKWEEKCEKVGLTRALTERFGHPVGIDEPHVEDFIPGGHLVSSGYLSSDGVPKYGDEEKITLKWTAPKIKRMGLLLNAASIDFRPVLVANADKKDKSLLVRSLKDLGDLSLALSSAQDSWFTRNNRSLPHYALFYGTSLAATNPVGGGFMPDGIGELEAANKLKEEHGIELAPGPYMHLFPTLSSRIAALKNPEKSLRESLFPHGFIGEDELNYSNELMVFFNDLTLVGKEFYADKIKAVTDFINDPRRRFQSETPHLKLVEAKEAEDGDFFPRSFSEGKYHGWARPICGTQRGEAVKLYMTKPGTYLRRTGSGGSDMASGVSAAVYDKISFPSLIPNSYLDPALGELTCGLASGLSPIFYKKNYLAFANIGLEKKSDLDKLRILATEPGYRRENVFKRILVPLTHRYTLFWNRIDLEKSLGDIFGGLNFPLTIDQKIQKTNSYEALRYDYKANLYDITPIVGTREPGIGFVSSETKRPLGGSLIFNQMIARDSEVGQTIGMEKMVSVLKLKDQSHEEAYRSSMQNFLNGKRYLAHWMFDEKWLETRAPFKNIKSFETTEELARIVGFTASGKYGDQDRLLVATAMKDKEFVEVAAAFDKAGDSEDVAAIEGQKYARVEFEGSGSREKNKKTEIKANSSKDKVVSSQMPKEGKKPKISDVEKLLKKK